MFPIATFCKNKNLPFVKTTSNLSKAHEMRESL